MVLPVPLFYVATYFSRNLSCKSCRQMRKQNSSECVPDQTIKGRALKMSFANDVKTTDDHLWTCEEWQAISTVSAIAKCNANVWHASLHYAITTLTDWVGRLRMCTNGADVTNVRWLYQKVSTGLSAVLSVLKQNLRRCAVFHGQHIWAILCWAEEYGSISE